MITYRGFQAGQAKKNNLIWITKDKKPVLHMPCDRLLSEEELKTKVDAYIKFAPEVWRALQKRFGKPRRK